MVPYRLTGAPATCEMLCKEFERIVEGIVVGVLNEKQSLVPTTCAA